MLRVLSCIALIALPFVAAPSWTYSQTGDYPSEGFGLMLVILLVLVLVRHV